MAVVKVSGNIVDLFSNKIYFGEVTMEAGRVASVEMLMPVEKQGEPYLLPGFIDSHVHIESSMLVPSEFARLAVVHGTVATVSDPHEIANVCGMAGVEYMIENGKTVPFKFNFGAPSCVPATSFETAGAVLNAIDVKALLQKDEIKYLSEMMNFPGVLSGDEEVMQKITAAQELGKPVDGHAPGLKGEDAKRYINAAPLNLPEGETSDSDNTDGVYGYQTADPMLYGLLKDFVSELRNNPTDAEITLWEHLKGKQLSNYKFRRQHIIGGFIADFVCLSKKLVIEVDGLIHQLPENKINDAERTIALNEFGFEVIRFSNSEVLHQIETVTSKILQKLETLPTTQDVAFTPPSGVRGAAVISTDHECFTKEEALDKLKYGMKIIIREGSAAKNFEALAELIDEYPDRIMLCSDDKHPDSLVEGHINQLCARAVAKGVNVFNVLKAACVNPVLHYKLDVGLLRAGDAADFIVVDDLQQFHVQQTYINGKLVAENGKSLIESTEAGIINNFNCDVKPVTEFEFHLNRFGTADEENIEQVYVIEAMDGQLITNKLIEPIGSFQVVDDIIQANTEKDLLYMVVVNRYSNAPVAKSFVKNFGLKKGAIASSVAHDSHNIIAVGVDAESVCKAVNLVIEAKGGVSVATKQDGRVLPLPVAGLMSTDDGYKVAEAYSAIDAAAKELGSTLAAPFMTLSFMGLLVIPHVKLSDMGLFDGDRFQLV
jgi:adenine deaminase/very-short-patch-repair endonuclease